MTAMPDQNKMHVFLVWTYKNWGGAQIYFLSIVRNAPPNWKFTILLPKGVSGDIIDFFAPYRVEFEFLENSFELVAANGLKERMMRQFSRIRVELEVIRRLRSIASTDAVIHVEAGPWQSWAYLYILSASYKTFVTVHNALPSAVAGFRRRLWSWRLNSLVRRPKFNIFAANQNALESVASFIDAKYLHTLTLTRATFNKEDVEAALEVPLDRLSLRKRFDIIADEFVVLCVGQFIDRKGRWVFLDAAQQIVRDSPSVTFVWVGPIELTEEEKFWINEYGLGEKFRFVLSSSLGKRREDVLAFFRSADIFVLPSLLEGLPISILEAMALGLPVISTRINAIPEAVIDGETGTLIEAGSAAELAAAINRLKSDDRLRKRFGELGREFAYAEFDERKVNAIILDRYQKAE